MNSIGMTFILVVFLALIGLLHSAPVRQSVVRQTVDRDEVNIGGDFAKGSSSPTKSNLPPYCNFTIFTSDSFHPAKEFKRLVNEGAIFVYLRLEFVSLEFDDLSSAYLEDIGDIIDPLTWVWSKGGKGKLLLGAPFDYTIKSLTTLSYGVFSLTVKINASSVCNEPISTDDETIEAIKGLLQDMTKGEDGTDQTEVGDDGEELICLEKQLKDWENSWFLSSPYRLIVETSAYNCWQRGGGQIKVGHNEFWLSWIRVICVILALFSPMAMRFFLQKNPPKRYENGVERLSLASDLPLGLKYWLCNWGNNCFCVLTMRCSVFGVLFILIEYIPQIILKNTESYQRRYNALNHFKLTITPALELYFYSFINALTFVFYVFLLPKYFGGQGMRTGSQNTIETQEESRSDSRDSFGYQTFFDDEMDCRAKMILNVPQWMSLVMFSWPHDLLFLFLTKLESVTCFIIIILLAILFYIPCVLVNFAYFLTETLPLLFFLKTSFTFFLKLFFQYFLSKSLDNLSYFQIFVCSVLLLLYILVFGMFAWIYKLVLNLLLVSEVLLHTFIGTAINAENVSPFMLAVFLLAKYIADVVTGFYDEYCVLLSDVMKEAEVLMDEAERQKINDQTGLGEGRNMSNLMNVVYERNFDSPVVKYQSNGTPTLELRLFWLIVEKYRPIRVNVARMFLQVFGIILLFSLWVQILLENYSVDKLSTVVKLVSPLVLVGIFPLVTRVLNSPASQDCTSEARKKNIKIDIWNIMTYGELATTKPKEITFPPRIQPKQ